MKKGFKYIFFESEKKKNWFETDILKHIKHLFFSGLQKINIVFKGWSYSYYLIFIGLVVIIMVCYEWWGLRLTDFLWEINFFYFLAILELLFWGFICFIDY